MIRWNTFILGQCSDFYALADHLDAVLISGGAEIFRIRMAALVIKKVMGVTRPRGGRDGHMFCRTRRGRTRRWHT